HQEGRDLSAGAWRACAGTGAAHPGNLDACASAGAGRARQMEANVAEDLGEALELFSELRLQQQLRRLQGEDADLKDNHIVVQRLSSLERDLLREALQLVNDFKQRISRHFHLEY